MQHHPSQEHKDLRHESKHQMFLKHQPIAVEVPLLFIRNIFVDQSEAEAEDESEVGQNLGANAYEVGGVSVGLVEGVVVRVCTDENDVHHAHASEQAQSHVVNFVDAVHPQALLHFHFEVTQLLSRDNATAIRVDDDASSARVDLYVWVEVLLDLLEVASHQAFNELCCLGWLVELFILNVLPVELVLNKLDVGVVEVISIQAIEFYLSCSLANSRHL